MSDGFRIAQVAPYAWDEPREVNVFIERLAAELAGRGHELVILAPSGSRSHIRDSRKLIAAAVNSPAAILKQGQATVLAVGQSIPIRTARSGGKLSLPIDISRTIEKVLTAVDFDIVHVHEPFAPSAASAALRHSRALNVGTFHRASERVLSTQLARRIVELLFGRLDARTTNFKVTHDLISSYFPGEYRVVNPGVDQIEPAAAEKGLRPLKIVFCAEEERQSLRVFLRALRKLPKGLPWEAVIWSRHPQDANLWLSRHLRERVSLVGSPDGEKNKYLAEGDIVCACSVGTSPTPQLLQQAMASGSITVCSRLPLYEELLEEGEDGLMFEPGEVATLAAQLTRLIEDGKLRRKLRQRALKRGASFSWGQMAAQFEQIYLEIADRRHPINGNTQVRKRLAGRRLIHCDLHMHTDHSPDCATPVDLLLETAKARGLDAIAITDHNEISGALEARELSRGIKVIVGEEIKTAGQGEVIGLFLERKIPRGMTLAETIAAIRRQGGLVYVPHPFDRLHSVPDYDNLMEIVGEIDIIEIFNPRVAISAFNEEAERFAAKYRIVAAAGSDSHVAQGLGSVKIRMRDFDGPQEFLESLRGADMVRKHKNLVYVQTLKFLQTTGRSKGQSSERKDAARRSK